VGGRDAVLQYADKGNATIGQRLKQTIRIRSLVSASAALTAKLTAPAPLQRRSFESLCNKVCAADCGSAYPGASARGFRKTTAMLQFRGAWKPRGQQRQLTLIIE
jgi:hypothetical protein